MHPYPHRYRASAAAGHAGPVQVASEVLPTFASGPPPEFDGPGGIWSPETLLVAAVADCFILTFRAIARASRFEWRALHCETEGLLERTDAGTWFTVFRTHARLEVPAGSDIERAKVLLEKAERGCLVANSLRGARELTSEVVSVR
jgi:organic hydroperoxide reductase OsmC/OhrA